jgi:hypothetical protein
VFESPYRDGRFIGVRYDRDRRAWVARIDPNTLRVRLLAVVDDVSGDCGIAGETLYCRRLDASIGLWQLPE